MSLTGLLDVVVDDPAVREAVEAARTAGHTQLDLTAPPGVRPFVLAALAARGTHTLLAVTATGRESEDLVAALTALLPAESVVEFPAWETLPHERLSPRSDTVGRRLATLRRLAHPSTTDAAHGPVRVVVAPVRSLLQPQARGLGDLEPVVLRAGDQMDLDETAARLVAAGYSRVDLVSRRGEFAVRGGILDVFPPTEEHPLRLELWGDEVDEIRYFTVADQRSLTAAGADAGGSAASSDATGPHPGTAGGAQDGLAPELWAPPCRELLLTDEVRKRAAALVEEHPGLADVLTKIAEGMAVEGMESLAPVLTDGMELLVDVVPAGTHIVLCDPERVRARSADLVATSQEFLDASWAAAAAGAATPIDLGAASLRGLAEVRERALTRGLPWWSVTPFTPLDASDQAPDQVSGSGSALLGGWDELVVDARGLDSYRGDFPHAVEDIRGWLSGGWRVVLVTEGHGPGERLVEVLRGEGLAARFDPDLPAVPEPSVAHVATGVVGTGFLAPALRLAVVTEADLSGQRTTTRDLGRMPSRRRGHVDPLTLKAGDFVVHEQHGVGRYVEMVQRTVGGATREYLVLEYAPAKRGQPGDRLYVPTDQLEQITRYVGGESPSLHRLGGADWAKTKSRARRAVKEISAELIKVYSARMAAPGHTFAPDTPWQRELEDAFPYMETPDQLACIDEVKADMEKPVPMDRLICGDVGYGKTEIAVRAAFKAVQDGKQVAVLVPTTLLVQQHFSTFSERYANFPVTVKALSRVQSDAEAQEVLRGLADGSVDVVIGTHRLFAAASHFKALGLVVVDEEQRFGVEHKERLKQLRANVDVLTMSATPIPRTLEMAVSGIREMSTIATPPEERHPVLTFVGPYDDKQIGAAIRRELLREGQVFYIHNRVDSIDAAAVRLRTLVPEARIATAHGQMNEHTLENLIVDFWNKKFDVLVCTTIVESGIDIANANTLVVERGDTFGLSQLHQLRGRVGRGRERAYAYFLYPPEAPLSETAHERLATIAAHTDLGSGMYVAMKDLEIRGAGNLLGGEQSGHIAGVGFDLYMRMVGEAVAQHRDEAAGDGVPGKGQAGEEEEPADVKVEIPVDAHLPHEYIPGERLRLEAYRRIAAIASEDGIEAVREELRDRYGALPRQVENLLEVAGFRVLARRAGLTDITAQGNFVRFGPVELRESEQLRLQRLYPKSVIKAPTRTILVPRPTTARIGGTPLRDVELLRWCRDLVQAVLLESRRTVATSSSRPTAS